uniref:Tudor domain-containing protein n=1 Tax=Macrostomum lignano TaxID=282301 RepID=A0A1I8FGS6_9PLAT
RRRSKRLAAVDLLLCNSDGQCKPAKQHAAPGGRGPATRRAGCRPRPLINAWLKRCRKLLRKKRDENLRLRDAEAAATADALKSSNLAEQMPQCDISAAKEDATPQQMQRQQPNIADKPNSDDEFELNEEFLLKPSDETETGSVVFESDGVWCRGRVLNYVREQGLFFLLDIDTGYSKVMPTGNMRPVFDCEGLTDPEHFDSHTFRDWRPYQKTIGALLTSSAKLRVYIVRKAFCPATNELLLASIVLLPDNREISQELIDGLPWLDRDQKLFKMAYRSGFVI